ncbi:hypothetical protein LEP1GSC050_3089 [Leptospira broomii serovar Hurstbridge str. 5399]|uniref:Uncharacterized protein n=1 Tax=Leptospira broomii serovar Hurstbridge str. 5399 TaxID=1049789 RepID=T0GFZ5_9LEPT|nr:hypothetical protein [Leptospira broomii]EQA44318.1 hypothetical protein LEP1GSC050_3089 [Leptospira broomii serovar Hurstbridge str. 5399]
MSTYQERVLVNGNEYILQHPGTKEWIKLKSKMFRITDGNMDLSVVLEYCFDYVVFPDKGAPKLSIDGPLDPEGRPIMLQQKELKQWIRELEEVWEIILPRFLRGELEPGFSWPESRPENGTAAGANQSTRGVSSKA